MSLQKGQNLNFAVPIDYAKGMLSSNQPRPLASFYEPEPEANKSTEARTSEVPSSASTAKPSVSEEMRKESLLYLQKKLRIWTKEDAGKELGDPARHHSAYNQNNMVDGEIYAYPDPTQLFRELELDFDLKTSKLRTIYASPWNMTWDQCKELWGENAKRSKQRDGTRYYAYKNRRLDVYVDRSGKVETI